MYWIFWSLTDMMFLYYNYKKYRCFRKNYKWNKHFPSIEHCMALNSHELPDYVDILRDIMKGNLKPRKILKKYL